jgi:hypothetical protein
MDLLLQLDVNQLLVPAITCLLAFVVFVAILYVNASASTMPAAAPAAQQPAATRTMAEPKSRCGMLIACPPFGLCCVRAPNHLPLTAV